MSYELLHVCILLILESRRWRSGFAPQAEGSNPSRDRHKSLNQTVTVPLPDARQKV